VSSRNDLPHHRTVPCIQHTMLCHAISSWSRLVNEEMEGVYDTSIAVVAACWRLFASLVSSSLSCVPSIASNGRITLPSYTPACATLPVAGMPASLSLAPFPMLLHAAHTASVESQPDVGVPHEVPVREKHLRAAAKGTTHASPNPFISFASAESSVLPGKKTWDLQTVW